MKKTTTPQPPPGRNAKGQFLPGVCGCPAAKLKPGHPRRFKPGVSGNPAGMSKVRAEHDRLVAAIKNGADDPELARLFWRNLHEGLKSKEQWATLWYGDTIVKPLLPKQPGIALAAGVALEVNGDEALDAFLSRIAGIAARAATGADVEDAQARAIAGPGAQVGVLGAAEPA